MALSLEICCPSMGGHEQAVLSWQDTMAKPWDVRVDEITTGVEAGFLYKLDKFTRTSQADLIAFFHSDLYVHEHGWDARVLAEFSDEAVVAVGFVGATRLGHENIYKVPYDYTQLARGDVWSNLTDAEAHGEREPRARDVVVLDSCAIVVRRDFLASVGGWPVQDYPNNSHCTDLWLAGMAAREHKRTRVVGVAASHMSGGKGEAGTSWLDERGGDVKMHREAHRVTYEMFRDVLPLRTGQ